MRILLAIDGSAAAARARDLVDRIQWPPETVIRVAAALDKASDLVGPGVTTPPSDSRDIETSLVRRLDDALDTAVRELERDGRTLERILLRGRAASAVVQEAKDFGADLIVVGNRGHGRMNTMLLGSVFVLWCDDVARTVLSGEIPLGILTSFVGAAVFLTMLTRQRLGVQR